MEFTMESADSKAPVLETVMVCLLSPCTENLHTHTDSPLHCKSYHPNHVKRGIVRYISETTRRIEREGKNIRMLVREVMRRFQLLLNMLGSSITPLNGKR